VDRPLLLIDVDGVISLFGFDPLSPPPGRFEFVDGIAHFLSAAAADHLRELGQTFELAWCSGWEEKANEYLPAALGLPAPLPYLEFGPPSATDAHWKLAAIDAYAGAFRPLAWVDDAHDERCHRWAGARGAPTLLIPTEPSIGLTPEHVAELLRWAKEVCATSRLCSQGM
jgi:hypothetical protein